MGTNGVGDHFRSKGQTSFPIPAENWAMAEEFCRNESFKVRAYDQVQDLFWLDLDPKLEGVLSGTHLLHFGYYSTYRLAQMQKSGKTTWDFPFYSLDRSSIKECPVPMPQKPMVDDFSGTDLYFLLRDTDLRIDFQPLLDKFVNHYFKDKIEEMGGNDIMFVVGSQPIDGPILNELVPMWVLAYHETMYPSMLFEFGALYSKFIDEKRKEIPDLFQVRQYD